MGIKVLFKFGPEVILIKVDGQNVQFANTVYGAQLASIDGLKLSKQGVEREFPDLIDKDDWRDIAIERFKDKMKLLNSESQIVDYLIADLKKYGYAPMKLQRNGHRPIDISQK